MTTMKFNAAVLAAILMIVSNAPTRAQSEEILKHRWKHRVVLLLESDFAPTMASEQQEEFIANQKGMMDRRLVVYTVSSNGFRAPGSAEEVEDGGELYERMKSLESPFELALIGLDGGVKERWSKPVQCEELFAIIDGMPMRRHELKQRKSTLDE